MVENEQLKQFISSLNLENWYRMAETERLQVLQRFENILAELEGRPSIPIRVIPPEQLREEEGGILFGYFSPSEKVICINPKFLKSRKSITGVSVFDLPQILETIAHEGRHAWQHYVIDHPEKKLVDRKTRLAILMNMSCYCSGNNPNLPFSCYEAQLIELDARRFARDVLEHVSSVLAERDHHLNLQFVHAIRKIAMRENRLAAKLIKDVSKEELMKYDEACRMTMKGLCPGVDFSEVTVFQDSIEFLKDKNMQRFTEGYCIRTGIGRVKTGSVGIYKENMLTPIGFRERKRHKVL